ncbi:MAG: DNA recombination protein RmuC, partial [Sphingobacteriia bacterium]
MDFVFLFIGLAAGAAIGYLVAKSKAQVADTTGYTSRIASLETELQYLHSQLATHTQQLQQREAQLGALQQAKGELEVALNSQLSQRMAHIQALEERLQTQKEDFRTLWANQIEQFEALSQKVLKENSQQFRLMSQEQLDHTLKPLQQRLQEFGSRVEASQKEQVAYHSQLAERIKHLTELNQQVGQEARQLAQALKGDKKMQGNWGENILEMVLERSGMLKDQFYLREEVYKDAEGRSFRPDVVVKLPGRKGLIIDSKVSLVAYEQYYNAEEAAEQARHLRAHTESIRTHIKLLAEKDYSMLEGLAHSPDFVLMFIPLEPAFNLAVSSDTGLFEYALSKKVVLVTTTTLLATLTTVASIWRQERQQQNVEEIARLAGSLYDKLVGFTEDMIKIGEQLDRAKDSYV